MFVSGIFKFKTFNFNFIFYIIKNNFRNKMCKFLLLSIFLVSVEASSNLNASSESVFKDLKSLGSNYFNEFEKNNTEAIIRCGGIPSCKGLNQYLVYKPFTSLEDGERCFWIIYMPNTQNYWIKLDYLGIQRVPENSERHAGLILTAISVATEERRSYNLDVPDVSLAVQADFLIVSLWTKAESFSKVRRVSDTGFILNFQSKQKPLTPSSSPLITTQQIVLPGTNIITHPENPPSMEQRASQELSIYVLVPSNNIWVNSVANVNTTLSLLYKKLSTVHDYSCDNEKIIVYEFQRKNNTLIPDFMQKKIICDDDLQASVKLNDVGLMIVRNKARNIQRIWQFEFEWTD